MCSLLNPLAPIFVPQNPTNIILQKLAPINYTALKYLDAATQIALDALWQDQINEAIMLHYADEIADDEIDDDEIADEIAAIRATH